jgi:hypothetical protein
MAYSTSNPPKVLAPRVGGDGPALWTFKHTDDDATINGASYVSNGDDLGMKEGDFVFYYDTTNDIGSVHVVGSVVAAGAATLQFAVVA